MTSLTQDRGALETLTVRTLPYPARELAKLVQEALVVQNTPVSVLDWK
jgi:hypothetical protein